MSTLGCGVAGTARFCVSLAFGSVWEEARCAEIEVPLWCRGSLRNVAESCWCWNKAGCGFFWAYQPGLCLFTQFAQKFHLWLLWVFWLFASFFTSWLHIVAMELGQILSLHPKPIISSAFSSLSFLAAASSQNSIKLASHRLVQAGPRAGFRKQNKTVVYFNRAALLGENSFSLILCSFYLQGTCWRVSQRSSCAQQFGMLCLRT